MEKLALIEQIARSWKHSPEYFTHGSDTGLSAALWTNRNNSITEVNTKPVTDQHIVCLKLEAFSADYWRDGRLTYSGPSAVGDVSIVPAGSPLRAIMHGKFSCLHFYVPDNFLQEIILKDSSFSVSENFKIIDPQRVYDPVIEGIGREILGEMYADLPLSQLRVDALGLDLGVQMIRKYSTESILRKPPLQAAKGGLTPRQLRRIVDLLKTDLSEDYALSSLAAEVGLSTFHFARSFKISAGVPPYAYLTNLRMEKAKALLSNTNMPITEIAFEIGYQSNQALARTFKKTFNCSPMQFRRDRPF